MTSHSITETLHGNYAYVLPMIDRFHGMQCGRFPFDKAYLDELLVALNKAAHQFMTEIRSELRILTLTGLDHNLQHLYVDLHNVNVVICDIQIFANQHQRQQQAAPPYPCLASCCCIL